MYVPTFHHTYVPMYLRTHLPTCLPPGAPPPRRAGGCSGCWTQCPRGGATNLANKFEHAVASPGSDCTYAGKWWHTTEEIEEPRWCTSSSSGRIRVDYSGRQWFNYGDCGGNRPKFGSTYSQPIYLPIDLHTHMHAYIQTNEHTYVFSFVAFHFPYLTVRQNR